MPEFAGEVEVEDSWFLELRGPDGEVKETRSSEDEEVADAEE